ncbi:pyridoxamine-phosphate oxidase [Candidatus Pantoea deserta]|uniref:Pyridoxamine-phosphate oxidase n=1 Tax=Candidatus Pantoea deserta TaxID=1869313 RepID=A0A3N4PP62_9GAMM|nr:pyridoxamine-phosphate oxidase [Pantoea deserta]
MRLDEIDNDCWTALENGAKEPECGFHFLTVASVDQQGKPQARTMVLRDVDRVNRTLEIHTDMRSPKWRALGVNQDVTVLGYCNKIQLRLQGTAELHAAHSEVAANAWQRLSPRTQQTYAGGAPGSDTAISSGDKGDPENNFGVMLIRISLLDWCQLARENNQRALLHYRADGAFIGGKEVNP